MKDLPDTYGDNAYVSKSRGWQPVQIPFLDSTREAWAGLPVEWQEYPAQVYRWAALTDKFARTAAASISAELRRLEKHLLDMIAEARAQRIEAIRATAPEQPVAPQHIELDAMLDEILSNGA